MDFHGMKRRKLQKLCMKHGIPANIKNTEMANRLTALFQDQTSRDEVGKQEERTATESPDVLNTSQNEGVSVVVVDLHDESNVAACSPRESFLGDGLERNEENKTVELHCEYGTITTSSSRLAVFGNAVAENSGGNKAMEFHEESVVFTGMEERLGESGWLGLNSAGKSASLHSQLLHDDSGGKEAVRTAEEAPLELLEEAAKSEESDFSGANITVKCHEMSDAVTASEQHTAGKKEREEVEFKDESAFLTRFDDTMVWGSHVPALDLGENADSSGSSITSYSHDESNAVEETACADFMSKGSQAENVAVLNATQGSSKKIIVNYSPHVDSVTDIEGADTIMECKHESEIFLETTPPPSLVQLAVSSPTGPILVKETVSTLIAEEDAKNNEETVLKENRFVAELAEAEAVVENSAVHLRLSINKGASSVLGESAVFTTPERNLLMTEQLSHNGKYLAGDSLNHHSDEAVESHAVVFTTPEQVLLLGDTGVDEVGKQVDCDNVTGANVTAKSHDMSDLLAAFKSQSIMGDFEPFTAKKQEREEVEFKDESAFFTKFETCLLLGESAHGNNMSGSSHHDSSAKVVVLKDDNLVLGSHVPDLDLGDNTTAEFNAGEETAGACLDATKGTTEQSKRNSPHVDSANLFDLGVEGADTTMDAERNVSFSSYVPAGTSSLLPEESSPLTYTHDQINDALEELAITGELTETKVATQGDDKGDLMLDSSGGAGRMST